MGDKKLVGKVKFFKNSYGFITSKQLDQDVFVFFDDIQGQGYRTLKKDQVVEFELKTNDRNYKAKNVRVLERNTAIEHDTEDKDYWCDLGSDKEEKFIEKIVPLINKNIIIHPKKKNNPKYIDLLNIDKNQVADLKTQNTPFFTASKYNYDSQWTVTFNRKDYLNYKERYPNAIIYWWVFWTQLEYKIKNYTYSVKPLYGVWEVSFDDMRRKIENKLVPLHPYKHRKNDPINAKDSYLFDLRSFKRLYKRENCK